MNGIRIEQADSLEERLAAVAVSVQARHSARGGFPPDYADFRDAFRPFVRLALALARLEALDLPAPQRAEKRRAWARELLEVADHPGPERLPDPPAKKGA